MSWYTFLRLITLGIYKIPFNHDPANFKILAEKATDIVSDTYVYLKYSANGGISWRYVMASYSPILQDDKWILDKLIFSIENKDYEYSFSSYDDILTFEEREKQKVREGNKKLTKEQLRRRQQIKDTINQKNSEYRGTP